MSGGPVTTLYDYQLSMLHAMCKSAPAQAADLLERVGATLDDAAIAEKRWWYADATNNFTSIEEYVSAWGAPASEEPQSESNLRHARWDLSFWPGLQIEFVEVGRDRRQVFRRLHRRSESPRPRLDSVADLTPWSCTSEELRDSGLGPVDFVDGFGSVGDVLAFTAVDPDSRCSCAYFAHVDWGLLQSVKPAPDWYAAGQ
ncbi:hypothetical protein [Nocardia tengchongensis]|uniref:hypothetical protein n=1 Tax=Nocardia tengchongensis TaxID=2055889 RepID=UPI003618705E